MVIIIKWLYFPAVTIWPFILIREKDYNKHILNHEWIHWKQILTLGVLPAYILYWTEFIVKLCYYRNIKKAYNAISFEREAHLFQEVFGYAQKRKWKTVFKFIYMADNPTYDYTDESDYFETIYELPVGSVVKFSANYESLIIRIEQNVPDGKVFRVLPIIPGTSQFALYGPNHIMVVENTDS